MSQITMTEHKEHDLTKTIGECGRFQVAIALVAISAVVASVWGLMFMAFGIYNPGWTCADNATLDISSSFSNVTIIQSGNNGSSFQKNKDREWTLDCKVKKKCINLVYNQESSTIVTEWDLSCDSAYVPSVIISIQMAGVLIGSIFSGEIGDKFGRKISLYGHLFFHGLCHFLALFSVSWQMYTVVLFFIGFSVAGILSSSSTYPLEFLNVQWRGIFGALPIWSFGCTLFGIFVFILRDWRHLHISAVVASALVFLTLFWTPESVRWLTVNGKIGKAKQVVAKIASMNGRACPDTSAIDCIAEEEKIEMGGHKYTLLDLFRTEEIRGYAVKFGLMWFIMSLTFYLITFGIKVLTGDFYVNLILFSVFQMPTAIFLALTINKLGRRRTALLYFCIGAASSISVVIVFFNSSSNVKDMCILILAMLCKLATESIWSAIGIFSSELFPTVVRTIHIGYLQAASKFASIVAPFLIPKNPDNLYMPYLIIAVLAIVNVAITWSLPETKGKILQDRIRNDKAEASSIQASGLFVSVDE